MAKYRYKDKTETNEFGQTLGYAIWMGGTELTYVAGIICADGVERNWFKTGEALTYTTIPGYVHVGGKKVHGCLISEYVRDFKLNSTGVDGEFIEGVRYKFAEWPKDGPYSNVIPLSMPNF